MLKQNYPEVSKVPYRHVYFKLFGHLFENYSIMKLLWSYNLDTLFERIMNKYSIISRFKKLPSTEPYRTNG